MDHESSVTMTDVTDTQEPESVAIPARQAGCTKRQQRIYFIQCNGNDGPIKIGIAVDPNRRLSELRIGCPYPMALLAECATEDADAEERRLHLVFRHLRIHGEWFTYATELREAIVLARSDARAVAQAMMNLAGMPEAMVRRRFAPRKTRITTPPKDSTP